MTLLRPQHKLQTISDLETILLDMQEVTTSIIHAIMKTMKKHLLIFLASATIAVLVSSCNTFRGVGNDLRAVGSGMARAAS